MRASPLFSFHVKKTMLVYKLELTEYKSANQGEREYNQRYGCQGVTCGKLIESSVSEVELNMWCAPYYNPRFSSGEVGALWKILMQNTLVDTVTCVIKCMNIPCHIRRLCAPSFKSQCCQIREHCALAGRRVHWIYPSRHLHRTLRETWWYDRQYANDFCS